MKTKFKRNFKIARLHELNISEQIRTVNSADLILATHGASLTWMTVLSHKCSIVLEFCTGADFHFVNLAHHAGVKHRCLHGTYHGSPSYFINIPETLIALKEIEYEWISCINKFNLSLDRS